MIQQGVLVPLLVLAQKRVGKVGTVNLDSVELRRGNDECFFDHGILEVGVLQASHFKVCPRDVSPLEVCLGEIAIKERGALELAPLEVAVPAQALLEGDAVELLLAKVAVVEIRTARRCSPRPSVGRGGRPVHDLEVTQALLLGVGGGRPTDQQKASEEGGRCSLVQGVYGRGGGGGGGSSASPSRRGGEGRRGPRAGSERGERCRCESRRAANCKACKDGAFHGHP